MQQRGVSLRAYTPGSDYSFAAGGSVQVVWGRGGNDTMIGYNPLRRNALSSQIDLMVADLDDVGLPEPGPVRNWNNVFKFGDAQQPYYLDRRSNGSGRFALVGDFDKDNDLIKLHGSADNYLLVTGSSGTGVYYVDEEGRQDLVTFLLGNQDLQLNGDYFEFEQDNSLSQPFDSKVNQFGTSSIDQSQTIAIDSEENIYLGGSTGGNLRGINSGGTRDFWLGKFNKQGITTKISQFGTPGFDQISEIVIGSQGDLFWSGFTTGDFAAPNQGERDIVVAKYDSDLNQVWARQYGGAGIDLNNDLAIDSQDNIYVVGIQVVGPSDDETNIVKFDTDGNELWSTVIGNPGVFDESYQITLGPDGSVYVAGWTFGDLGGPNAGLYDVWYAKLAPEDGEVEWIKQFGTADYEFPWGLVTDSSGDLYIAGWTLGNLGGPNAGSYDVWLRKTDSEGEEIFTRQYGTAEDDGLFKEALHIDSNDNLYLTGYTKGDFAGTNLGGFDGWVRQVNPQNGNTIWQEQFGTDSGEYPYDLAINPSEDKLYLTGLTEGNFGSINKGSTDIWALKLTANNGTVLPFNPSPNSNAGIPNFPDLEAIPTGIFSSWEPKLPQEVLSAKLDSLIDNTLDKYGDLMKNPPSFSSPI